MLARGSERKRRIQWKRIQQWKRIWRKRWDDNNKRKRRIQRKRIWRIWRKRNIPR